MFCHVCRNKGRGKPSCCWAFSLLAKSQQLALRAAQLRGQSQKLIQNAGDATAQIAQNALVEERAKLKHKNAAFAWLKADSKRTQNRTSELLGKGLLLGCENFNVLLKKGDPSQFCVKKKNAKQFTMRKTNLKFCNNSSRWVASRRMSVFFPPVWTRIGGKLQD